MAVVVEAPKIREEKTLDLQGDTKYNVILQSLVDSVLKSLMEGVVLLPGSSQKMSFPLFWF